ncbi:unnamed protein product [Somion occarium]|uniref:Pet127-domain-containing protein n=1 Tax=Somion occarium TaxID=3059160 RepID=A0ABP1DZR1_9APHY
MLACRNASRKLLNRSHIRLPDVLRIIRQFSSTHSKNENFEKVELSSSSAPLTSLKRTAPTEDARLPQSASRCEVFGSQNPWMDTALRSVRVPTDIKSATSGSRSNHERQYTTHSKSVDAGIDFPSDLSPDEIDEVFNEFAIPVKDDLATTDPSGSSETANYVGSLLTREYESHTQKQRRVGLVETAGMEVESLTGHDKMTSVERSYEDSYSEVLWRQELYELSEEEIRHAQQGVVQDLEWRSVAAEHYLPPSNAIPTENQASRSEEHHVDGQPIATEPRYEWPQTTWNENWGEDTLVPRVLTSSTMESGLPESLLLPSYASNGSPEILLERPPHEVSPYRETVKILDGLPHPTQHFARVVQGSLAPRSSKKELITDLVSPSRQRPIAKLAHGLDRVLFNPGVHWLQDPRSRVYNFTPRLKSIPKVEEFAFDRVTGFIKSSSDKDLWTLAKREKCRFVGSTSSLTGLLSHIYFLLSSMKPPKMGRMTQSFMSQSKRFAMTTFSFGQRLPVSIVLNFKDGVYATDHDPSDPGMSERNILTWMGTLLEKFLTTSEEEFEPLLRKNPPQPGPVDHRREAYRYAKFGKYVMRSQLDAQDSRLPGTGVFDLKTRAALPIRLDLFNYEKNSGYLIRHLHGPFESFEREYFDLIRSAFLKYSFQARIGNMDGIFAAYHNTAQIFGFQYIPLDEMDEALYGHKDVGKAIFEKCLGLLEVISDEITHYFPNQTVMCLWDTEDDGHVTHVWVEPKNWNVEDGARPIVQLDITASNYLDGRQVFGHDLPGMLEDKKWTVEWKIRNVDMDPRKIHQNKQAVKEKQATYWSLPEGVNQEQMAKMWAGLNFGGSTTIPTTFNAARFRPADPFVKHLRSLAKRGKEHTARLAREEAGKPQIIWGDPEDAAQDVTETPGFAPDEAPSVDPSEVLAATEEGDVDSLEAARLQRKKEKKLAKKKAKKALLRAGLVDLKKQAYEGNAVRTKAQKVANNAIQQAMMCIYDGDMPLLRKRMRTPPLHMPPLPFQQGGWLKSRKSEPVVPGDVTQPVPTTSL